MNPYPYFHLILSTLAQATIIYKLENYLKYCYLFAPSVVSLWSFTWRAPRVTYSVGENLITVPPTFKNSLKVCSYPVLCPLVPAFWVIWACPELMPPAGQQGQGHVWLMMKMGRPLFLDAADNGGPLKGVRNTGAGYDEISHWWEKPWPDDCPVNPW